MSKKKSLGHNPLAYSTRRHASFDFITPLDAQESQDDAEDNKGDKTKANKVTASYYLEESVVNKVRYLADKNDISYSAFVNSVLKKSLNKNQSR